MDKDTFGGAHKPSSYSFCMNEGEQVARYVFCQPYVSSKDTLDLGCGYGHGTAFLANHAKSVVGADTDERAIVYAKMNYTRPNLKFVLLNKSKFDDATFDIIISLEVIEHVVDPRSFLSEASRILRNGGQIILSTPNKLFTEKFYKNGKSLNPYHLHEFYPDELQRLLKQYFNNVIEFAQVWPDGSDVQIHGELIASCKIPKQLRAMVPDQIKNVYLRLKGLPPISDRRGKWRDYPILQVDQINKTFPVLVYQCIK